MYVKKVINLKDEQGKNLTISHRPLAKGIYIFESIKKADIGLNTYCTRSNSLMKIDVETISIANFRHYSTQIRRGQLIGRLTPHDRRQTIKEVEFDYEKVFTKKYQESKKIDNLFVMTVFESNLELNPDVNNYLREKNQKKVINIFKNHNYLFRPKLGRFNDKIKMLISFKNEKDISRLKQSPYSMSAKNQKAINEVLNPLIKDGRVQKSLFKMIFSAFFSTFVV